MTSSSARARRTGQDAGIEGVHASSVMAARPVARGKAGIASFSESSRPFPCLSQAYLAIVYHAVEFVHDIVINDPAILEPETLS